MDNFNVFKSTQNVSWCCCITSHCCVYILKLYRRVTCIHLPLSSKWLYVGTVRGNIHVVNIDTFALSGYIINWNKAIEV